MTKGRIRIIRLAENVQVFWVNLNPDRLSIKTIAPRCLMQAAFLFKEKYPNYDFDLKVIEAIATDDLRFVDSYVLAGVWGLCDRALIERLTRQNDRVGTIARLFMNNEGSMTRLASTQALNQLAAEKVFCVHFTSVGRRQALGVHQRLLACEFYRGFVEVLHDSERHRMIFSGYGPRMKVEQGKIHVLFTGEEDRFVADEILVWVKQNYGLLSVAIDAKQTGTRFSIFDKHADSFQLLSESMAALNGEWEAVCEHVLFKLNDVAPESFNELRSGIANLRKSLLAPEDCRQIATNLRRCLEHLADVLQPASSGSEAEKYKDRLQEFVKTRLHTTSHYSRYMTAEIQELGTRIQTLWKLLDKGVHEDWMSVAIKPLALRLVLLINELLIPVNPAVSRVIVEDDLFE